VGIANGYPLNKKKLKFKIMKTIKLKKKKSKP